MPLSSAVLHARMLLTIHSLLEAGELSSEESIRQGLSGNLCRCTGLSRHHRSGERSGLAHGAQVSADPRSVPRVDAREKLRGQAQFVGDMQILGMLHGKGATESGGDARIVSFDATKLRLCQAWWRC